MAEFIQLEFDFMKKSSSEEKISSLENKLEELKDSADRSRRRMFSEISELKKQYNYLLSENEKLQLVIDSLKK